MITRKGRAVAVAFGVAVAGLGVAGFGVATTGVPVANASIITSPKGSDH